MSNIIATAKTYKNPRTGQEFQNATITTGDLFISDKLVTLNFHLKADGGLDETFKYFWNNNLSDKIVVKRENKDKKDPIGDIVFLENLKELKKTDEVVTYGKFNIEGLNNNHEFDGQIPFDFKPTTELAWKQLFHNISFNGEVIAKQFTNE